DRAEVIARGGYEFEARERRAELIASGPMMETLKGRLSFMYSAADGYFINQGFTLPGQGGVNPDKRAPRSRTYFVRGTLLWNPTSQFDARLKLNYAYDKTRDSETAQLVDCPNPGGSSFAPAGFAFIANDNCKLDRYIRDLYL